MLLIADASPIISLIVVDKLFLLKQLFEQIYIPQAVWDELNHHNAIQKYDENLNWLKTQVKPVNYQFPITGIDKGETEAIQLYKELDANFLLIDDKKARQQAELLDIKCVGTLGILYLLKQKGLISELKPIFSVLIENKRYYSIKYINQFLLKANEPIF